MTSDFVSGNQTMYLWKALITYYHHARFQGSVISSPWEKFNFKVVGLHADDDKSQHNASVHSLTLPCNSVKNPIFCIFMAPDNFWPLQEVIKLCFFESPFHILQLGQVSSCCAQLPEKSTLTFLHQVWPLTFTRGNKQSFFLKAFITYYHVPSFRV